MLNYIKILIAVISILSLLEGLPSMTVETRPQIQSNQAIEIVNLQIPGVFVNLTLRIQPGEKVVLTGDNGSGKTLVLRLVGGYESYYQNPYIVPTLLEETNTPLLDDFLLLQNNLIWQSEFQEFHYLLNQSSLTRGQQLFLVIAATILSNKNTHILIDEALDPITGTLLAGIGQMIRWSKATILVTSHNKNVIKMFNRKLTIVDQEIKE